MATISPLESLSVELLEPIIDHLELANLSRLSRCNRALHSAFSPRILTTDGASNMMMRWAILNGQPCGITRALSLGADVVHVRMHGLPGYPRLKQDKILTLHLAAMENQVECFQTLLDAGAELYFKDEIKQSRHNRSSYALCRNYLFDYKNPDLLRRCVKSGIRDSILPLESALDELFEKAAVDLHVPEEVCKVWIDLGASWSLPRYPLSNAIHRAIVAGSVSEARQLASRTANLQAYAESKPTPDVQPIDSRGDNWVRNRWVFVAARSMAVHGTDIMQFCLDQGADINHVGLERLDWGKDDWPRGQRLKMTPLLMYLLLVKIHVGDGDAKNALPIRPVDGLQFLLDRGARVIVNKRQHLDTLFCGQEYLPNLELFWRRWLESDDPLHDDFGVIWQLLFQNGATEEFVRPAGLLILGHLVERGDGARKMCTPGDSECHLVKQRWRGVLDMVLRDGHDNVFGQDVDQICADFVRFLTVEIPTGDGLDPKGGPKPDFWWNCAHSITLHKFCEVGVDMDKECKDAHPKILNHLSQGKDPKVARARNRYSSCKCI